MKNFRLTSVAFITILIFGGGDFVSRALNASNNQSTQKSLWQRQKEKRAASKNQMTIGSPQNFTRNESKEYNGNVCGRCLNPIEAKKFTQGEINYCKQSCPHDPDIQNQNYPKNIFKENTLEKTKTAYRQQEVKLPELLRKLESIIGRETYRSCDQGLQTLYGNLENVKNPNAKSDFEYKLRQIRQSFHDVRNKNMQKMETLDGRALNEEEFIKNFFDMYIDYSLPAKNCRDYIENIRKEINLSITSQQASQRKGWSRKN